MIDINFDAWGNTKNNNPDYGIFGNEAHKQIGGDLPTDTNSGFDWQGFGKSMSNNLLNKKQKNMQPAFSFNPTMAQPGYVQNQFNSNPYSSTILSKPYSNLYDYLTR